MTALSNSTPPGPLRVLMVTPRYFPDMGGVENHVYQVAGRLARAGVQVSVLTTDREGKLLPCEQVNEVHIQRVRAWPARRDYYFAPGIYRTIQQCQWDLIHIQSYHTLVAPLAMLAARQSKIPYVLTFHGGGHSSNLRNAARGSQLALLRPLLARAERLVTLARFEKKFFKEQLHLPEEHFITIPNGADLPRPVQVFAPKSEETLIASIGRLERYKGHQRIIAAMPAILTERPQARLWVAGNGPYEPTLRSLAKKLGVEDRVEFRAIPPDQRKKMAEEVSRVNLVVLLSEYETHPIAILEALALGRQVLVADTSGLSELCGQGLARAVSLESTPAQVAAAVLDQLRNPLISGKINLPSWDDCAEGLFNLYREISARQLCTS
jgi:glycosyltransferase involved in cell wall biosynthesis